MRALNILFFIFILSVGNSCGLFSSEEVEDNDSTPVFTGSSFLGCSGSSRCVALCKKMFSAESRLLSKCLKTNSAEVAQINIVYPSMKAGRNWDSIKPEQLKVLVDFDDDIWPKYAGVHRVSAQEMLLWIAETEDVASLLDDEQAILKNAFAIIGSPYDDAVFEGMKSDVDKDRNHTFFEVSVLNNNDRAFRAAHELLKSECEGNKHCIKTVYCDIDQHIVFGKLNKLELGTDADVDGNYLFKDECND